MNTIIVETWSGTKEEITLEEITHISRTVDFSATRYEPVGEEQHYDHMEDIGTPEWIVNYSLNVVNNELFEEVFKSLMESNDVFLTADIKLADFLKALHIMLQ